MTKASSLGPKTLNGSRADAEAIVQTTARSVRPGRVHRRSTSPEHIGGTTAEIGDRKRSRSRSRLRQDVEIERHAHVEGPRPKLSVGDRPVVCQPDGHVKAGRLPLRVAIVRGTIETIVGGLIADAISS